MTFWTAVGAFGSIIVAVLAVWSEPIRNWLRGPRLSLEPMDLNGSLTHRNDETQTPVYFYYIKIVNSGKSYARDCRVLLKALEKKNEKGVFERIPLSIFCHFVVTPQRSFEPVYPTVADESQIDFGFIEKESKGFQPCFYVYPNNFQGSVGKGETVAYGLQVVAENFVSKTLTFIEVTWNGKWSKEPERMKENVRIRFRRP